MTRPRLDSDDAFDRHMDRAARFVALGTAAVLAAYAATFAVVVWAVYRLVTYYTGGAP